jgi:hypothetical protein
LFWGVTLYFVFSVLLSPDDTALMASLLVFFSSCVYIRHTGSLGLWVLCKLNDSKKAWYSFRYLFFESYYVFGIS